jgi:hypothetical protein
MNSGITFIEVEFGEIEKGGWKKINMTSTENQQPVSPNRTDHSGLEDGSPRLSEGMLSCFHAFN